MNKNHRSHVTTGTGADLVPTPPSMRESPTGRSTSRFVGGRWPIQHSFQQRLWQDVWCDGWDSFYSHGDNLDQPLLNILSSKEYVTNPESRRLVA